MSGKIANIGFNDLYFYFDIMDDRAVFNKIPVNKISKQEYSNVPASVIGKPKPIVYGVPVSNNGRSEDKWTLWPARLVNNRSYRILIANHKVGQNTFPDEVGTTGRVHIYMPEIEHYARLIAPNSSYVNADAGTYLTLESPISAKLYLHPTIKGEQYNCAVADYKPTIDNDEATKIDLTENETFYLRFSKMPNFGTIRQGSTFLGLAVKVGACTGSTPYAKMKYYNPDYDDGDTPSFSTTTEGNINTPDATNLFYFPNDNTAHGIRADFDDQDDAWTWDDIVNYEWGLTVQAGCTIELQEIYLHLENIIYGFVSQKTSSGGQVIPPTRWTGGG